MPNKTRISKLGSSTSNIIEFDQFFRKFHLLSSKEEFNDVKKGITVLSKELKNTILEPNLIEIQENQDDKKNYILSYEQKKLTPWIEPEWITGEQLFKLSETILRQQELLIKNDLCLVDARPSNYWLASNEGKLIDLASIKKLSQQNLLSFETDFKNNFINPLSLEKDFDIPVSHYFKGKLNTINLNLTASIFNFLSLTRFKQSIKNIIINFTSNKISSSSPEFIAYLNKNYQRNKTDASGKMKFSKSINNLSKLLKKVKPKDVISSDWAEYNNFHEEEYTKKKIAAIDNFVSKHCKDTKVVDLGSNLTTKDINSIYSRIDNDISVCRQMRQYFDDEKIILQLNIADCLCSPESVDFKALNLFDNAEASIMTSIIHHLLIDYGLSYEDFYKNLSKLYKNILLEFPTSKDPMVNLLIIKRNENIIWDWEKKHLPICNKYFEIVSESTLSDTRLIYELKKKKN